MVISALEYVAIANSEIHTRRAKIRVVACSFAYTAAEQHAVSLALLASVDAVVGALMRSASSCVQSHANHVQNLAHGVVLITNATIFVVKNATVHGVMPPVPKCFHAATDVLVCVEKLALICVPCATLKGSLSC